MTVVVRVLDPAEADEAAPSLLPLLGELSPSAAALSADELAERLRDTSLRVLVAEQGDELVGTATLCLLQTLTLGGVGHVDDVVVTASARGQGVGAALMTALRREAERLGLRHLDLTSRPSREAANRLYLSLGYERRETNVYRSRLG